jgi:DNA-binding NtrC family response regulator
MEDLIYRLRQTQGVAKLIGSAPVFLKAIEQLPAIARSEAAVVIIGATGTGKELVARAIHYLSDRAAFPFVAVNCGSFTHALLEDELFGHERGAYTDARARRQGLIAQAERGTLFLDEVDTLPSKAQVDLLRVLQDKSFRVIGSSVEHQADVRILAATNAPLDKLVSSGDFRPDLYYRLCVFSISLPALKDRKEDILPLANHFLAKHATAEKGKLRLTPTTCAALISCSWPGNVRELENAIIRGVHLSQSDAIEVEDLGLRGSGTAPTDLAKANSFKAAKREALETFEKDYLTRLMSEHQGNVSRAARAAGKERRNLGKLLKKHRLNPKLFHFSPAISPEPSADFTGCGLVKTAGA